jgi:hypothetical protein
MGRWPSQRRHGRITLLIAPAFRSRQERSPGAPRLPQMLQTNRGSAVTLHHLIGTFAGTITASQMYSTSLLGPLIRMQGPKPIHHKVGEGGGPCDQKQTVDSFNA